jgi:NADH-quinone oxidoreductase subunit E
MGMGMNFTPERQAELDKLLPRYPSKEAALLPAMRMAQEEFGYLSNDVIDFLAKLIGLPVARVRAVATFYTMFETRPVGRYHVQVCQNLTCSMMGAEHIVTHLEKRLGIAAGETTADKKFSLSRVECLGACGTAPVMQINDDYYEALTPEKVSEILEGLH